MKFKTLLLSTSLIAAAALFSYCAKENTTPAPAPATVETSTDDEAASRGVCNVNVKAINGSLTICGTQTAPTPCGLSPAGAPLFGGGLIPVGGNQNYTLATPTVMMISRTPGTVSGAVVIASVTGAIGPKSYIVPVVGSVAVTVDNVCNLF